MEARFDPHRLNLRHGTLAAVLAGVCIGLGWAAGPMFVRDAAASATTTAPAAPARFADCHIGGGTDCVVDGDTFRMGGVRIRIDDIDTPETHPARCAREAELGAAATRRLRALLNSGEVVLASSGRDTDRYGRQLRLVTVGGRGIGDMLIAEGLARRYAGGHRAGWCD
jgi:micrococcal nuclease